MKTKWKNLLLALGGLVVGFINGFFGGGGGMIAVPIFTSLMKLENKKAHATTMAVILPLSIASGIIYLIKGIEFSPVFLYVGGGVVAGGVIGALLLKRISNELLSMLFYSIMIAAGVMMIVKT